MLNCNINYENSSLILFLYNKIIENRIEITIDNKEIKLVNNTNTSNSLNVFSKIKFKNLKYVFCKDCNLNDKSLLMIKKLFSNNLIELDLSKNQFSDMTIFNNENNLINLNKLDLSYNKIIHIDSLINCKFLNLKELDLSHNEISEINCLKNKSYFDKLEILDLSDNKIKKLNMIKIKNLIS